VKGWPDTLKVAIAGAVTALQGNHPELHRDGVDWLVAENVLTTTPQLQPVGERMEYRDTIEIAREVKSSELSIITRVS
jgi:hypothetical protein